MSYVCPAAVAPDEVRMADDEKIQRVGVDAAEALRAAAELLADESIPFERRVEAYRRCIARHAMLSAKFLQMGNRFIMARSLETQRADSTPVV
jgi:hypothetical protein